MEMSPLFVRLPRGYAEKLDRAAFELKTPKQALVAGLVGRYVNPSTAEGLQNLKAVAAEGGFGFGTRRITVEQETDDVTVGRVGFVPAPEPPTGDVLTLEQVAVLLRVDPDAVRELADEGELPGREIAGEWRFARQAVLDWLGGS
jgi:excisionase family DNA binding protein